MHEGQQPCQHRRARGLADVTGSDAGTEVGAVGSETVQVRCADFGLEEAHGISSVLVCGDEQDIGSHRRASRIGMEAIYFGPANTIRWQ